MLNVSTNNGSSFINGTNKSTPHPDIGNEVLTVISELVCVVIFVVGLVGNSLVLIVFGSRWSRLKACEIFMVSLACADLVSTIITPSVQFLETMGVDFKPIGDVGCKLLHFSIMTGVTVSSITLMAITFDRYVIVKWPLRSKISFGTLRYVVLLTWSLGCGPGVLYLVGRNVRLYKLPTGASHCRQWLKNDALIQHTLVTFSIQLVIPLLVMIVLYSLTTYELWKTTKTIQFQMRERQMRERYERHKKIIKLLVVLVCLFFVCIIPVNILFVIYIYHQNILPMPDLIRLFTILQMLHMANSCINPIIYSKLHTSFRRMALKIFCSCCFDKVRSYEWIDLGGNMRSVINRTVRYASHRFSKPVFFGRQVSAGSLPNGTLDQTENHHTDDRTNLPKHKSLHRSRRNRAIRKPMRTIPKEKGIQDIINNVNNIPLLVSPSENPPVPVPEESLLPSYEEVINNSTVSTNNNERENSDNKVIPLTASNDPVMFDTKFVSFEINEDVGIDTSGSIPFAFNRSESYKRPRMGSEAIPGRNKENASIQQTVQSSTTEEEASLAQYNIFISSSIFDVPDE